MAKRTRKPTDVATGVVDLVTAFNWVQVATRDAGTPTQTHARISNGWLIASDGIVSAGYPVPQGIEACPHTLDMWTTLSKCEDATSITQLANGKLHVRSGSFAAFVDCVTPDLLTPIAPDQPVARIDARVISALAAVAPIAKENAQRLVQASIYLRANTALATSGSCLVEAWHGWDLPPVLLPKAFVNVLTAKPIAPHSFGFSDTSATFWFEGGGWIKSQLYVEPWPIDQADRILATQAHPWPIPKGMLAAIDKLAYFSNGTVHLTENAITTSDDPVTGAAVELIGKLPDIILDPEHLQVVLPQVTQADWFVNGAHGHGQVMMFGDVFRAVLSHMTPTKS